MSHNIWTHKRRQGIHHLRPEGRGWKIAKTGTCKTFLLITAIDGRQALKSNGKEATASEVACIICALCTEEETACRRCSVESMQSIDRTRTCAGTAYPDLASFSGEEDPRRSARSRGARCTAESDWRSRETLARVLFVVAAEIAMVQADSRIGS